MLAGVVHAIGRLERARARLVTPASPGLRHSAVFGPTLVDGKLAIVRLPVRGHKGPRAHLAVAPAPTDHLGAVFRPPLVDGMLARVHLAVLPLEGTRACYSCAAPAHHLVAILRP